MQQSNIEIIEYIYALFDRFEASFINGEFEIKLNSKNFHLKSIEVLVFNNEALSTFELSSILDSFFSLPDFKHNSIPNERLTIIYFDYYKKHIANLVDNDLIEKKLQLLATMYECLMISINHKVKNEIFEYIKTIRDENGLTDIKNTFLKVIREFQDYHILTEAPYVYLSDIHFRKCDGIYSYFSYEDQRVITKVRGISNLWTPKKQDNAYELAKEYFEKNNEFDISDMLMARARVYSEQQNCVLAILNAVMSLEVIVPKVTNLYLKQHLVSTSVIQDFDKKFGLSVRVKAFLKIIFPTTVHKVIDKVGEIITFRNRIVHEGWQESKFDHNKIHDLIDNCYILKKLLDSYMQNLHSHKVIN